MPYRMIGMENRFRERDEADVGVREQLQARHKTVKGDVPHTTRIIRSQGSRGDEQEHRAYGGEHELRPQS